MSPADDAAQFFRRAVDAATAGDADTAQRLLEQALALAPDHVPSLVNLGGIHQNRGALSRAEALFRKALAIAPETAFAHNNLALIHAARGDEAAAIAAWSAGLKADPHNAIIRFNLAGAFERTRQLDAALAQLNAILTRDPDHVAARMATVPILFELGQYEAAWKNNTVRHRLFWGQYPEQRRPLRSPLWRGEPLAGKKLLVSYEQGLGEQIMFASFFPRLLAQAARLLIECEERLVPLFARSFPTADVVAWQQPWSRAVKAADIDFHIPAGDLGPLLQENFTTPPAPHGHLMADPEKARTLRARYEALANGRKIVGVSWHSAAANVEQFKSLPLSGLKPLTEDPTLFCVSLQYGPAAKDSASLFVDIEVDPMVDIDAAAAQIAAMDHIVTVSTTTAHLAGALGKPTSVLLPKVRGRFWYWFPERSTNPWYATVRVFMQTNDGVWGDAIARAVSAIRSA